MVVSDPYSGLVMTCPRCGVVGRPLRVQSDCEVPISELEQIYCEKHTYTDEGVERYTYDVCALLRGGKKLRLVRNARLGIEDKLVAGELPREAA